MWKYYALLSALFAGITAVLAKTGVKGIGGNAATAIRTLVVLLIVWALTFFSGQMKDVKTVSKANLLFLVLSGLATGLSWIFYFKALETGPVSRVAPLDKLSVVFAICLAFVFLKEPVQLTTILGAALIVIGSVIIVLGS
ncbi:EamA family transporter [Pedobacter sp. HMF7647]|uniref:EamA family transporter n=1 Tax=Hufsiella arboris TaxID=2695275 RepID=A0A7K1YC16_9SPHI|nr:EamA family transporter [Hufsiella arboris]MXV51970.1 EamA family transporter [Hufsiella arboris]